MTRRRLNAWGLALRLEDGVVAKTFALTLLAVATAGVSLVTL